MAAGKELALVSKRRYAAVAITRNGIGLALKLGAMLGETEVFCYAKYSGGLEMRAGEISLFEGPVKDLLPGSSGIMRGLFCSSHWAPRSG